MFTVYHTVQPIDCSRLEQSMEELYEFVSAQSSQETLDHSQTAIQIERASAAVVDLESKPLVPHPPPSKIRPQTSNPQRQLCLPLFFPRSSFPPPSLLHLMSNSSFPKSPSLLLTQSFQSCSSTFLFTGQYRKQPSLTRTGPLQHPPKSRRGSIDLGHGRPHNVVLELEKLYGRGERLDVKAHALEDEVGDAEGASQLTIEQMT